MGVIIQRSVTQQDKTSGNPHFTCILRDEAGGVIKLKCVLKHAELFKDVIQVKIIFFTFKYLQLHY